MKIKLIATALIFIAISCLLGFGFDEMFAASIISAIGALIALCSMFIKKE